MTTRSKRMKKALEAFGWSVDDSERLHRDCHACGHRGIGYRDKFCSACGTKLKPQVVPREETTTWQLERAIQYALGETKDLP